MQDQKVEELMWFLTCTRRTQSRMQNVIYVERNKDYRSPKYLPHNYSDHGENSLAKNPTRATSSDFWWLNENLEDMLNDCLGKSYKSLVKNSVRRSQKKKP